MIGDDKFSQINTVMQYLALLDQCQHLASKGYSTHFCLKVMPKLEELIHNELFPHGELWDFWIEQTERKTLRGERS